MYCTGKKKMKDKGMQKPEWVDQQNVMFLIFLIFDVVT